MMSLYSGKILVIYFYFCFSFLGIPHQDSETIDVTIFGWDFIFVFFIFFCYFLFSLFSLFSLYFYFLYFHCFTFSLYLKMASGETIRQSYECSPFLGTFLCVKYAELCWRLVKLSQSFLIYFIILLIYKKSSKSFVKIASDY